MDNSDFLYRRSKKILIENVYSIKDSDIVNKMNISQKYSIYIALIYELLSFKSNAADTECYDLGIGLFFEIDPEYFEHGHFNREIQSNSLFREIGIFVISEIEGYLLGERNNGN